MSNSKKKHLVAAALILLLVTPIAGKSEDATKDPVISNCEECPATTDTKVLKGTVDVISVKASMLQLATGNGAKVIAFDDDTILIGTENFSNIAPDSDLEIEYFNDDGVLFAVSIKVANKIPILESNQIDVKTLSKLISSNTTPFTLIDARTDHSYGKAHIPGAVSIYNGVFAKNIDKLPANKQQLIVYYCDGTA